MTFKFWVPFFIAQLAFLPQAYSSVSRQLNAATIKNGSATLTLPTATGSLLGASPNNHGLVLSGSGATATVLAPDASTAKTLVSGGASADPSWATLGIGGGGTGQVTKGPAFDALSPMSASGDVIYGGTSGTGTRLPKGSDGQILTLVSGLPAWGTAGTAPDQSYELSGVGLSASVAANALTVALTQKDGSSNCSGGSPCKIGFRTATATTGGYAQASITGALSVVAPTGATFGGTSGVAQNIYVYAQYNAGTPELCLSGNNAIDLGLLRTTVTIDASSTSAFVVYCSTGRSSQSLRYLGRVTATEATAGTYATSPSAVSLADFNPVPNLAYVSSTVSSAVTPAGNAQYVAMGLSIALPNITGSHWKLSGVINFNNDGIASPSWGNAHMVWAAGDGANNSTPPTALTPTVGINMLSFWAGDGAVTFNQITRVAPEIIVTGNRTVYLVPYVSGSDATHGRLTGWIIAIRVD